MQVWPSAHCSLRVGSGSAMAAGWDSCVAGTEHPSDGVWLELHSSLLWMASQHLVEGCSVGAQPRDRCLAAFSEQDHFMGFDIKRECWSGLWNIAVPAGWNHRISWAGNDLHGSLRSTLHGYPHENSCVLGAQRWSNAPSAHNQLPWADMTFSGQDWHRKEGFQPAPFGHAHGHHWP